MHNALEVQVARPPTKEELDEWYQKNDLTPDKDGIFTQVPYGDAPVERSVILDQVEKNALRRNVPNLPTREYTPKIMVYVGGGPTLKDHLDEIKAKCEDEKYDVFTSNKTCSYLLSKGVVPNYHLILDPTEKKIKDIDYEEKVPLVLGLQCHPSLFDKAIEQGREIHKFLAASITNQDGRTDKEAAKEAAYPEDPIILGIGGGSMCGTRMLYFAAARGYRRIEYYGFDGCIEMKGNVVNCYAYFKPRGENIIETTASNGRTFHTTVTLLRQADELVQMMDILPGMDVEIYGDSLMSNHLKTYKELRKPAPYRISPEYLQSQKEMHRRHTDYGNSGHFHAPRVFMAGAQLHRKLGSCSILDYGAGPGSLKKALDRAFPEIPGMTFHEYEPALEGKDQEPQPADLVFCGDVLEHVEEECTDAVIQHLADLTKHLLIAVVALQPAKKTLPDGRNAHICLKPSLWWLSKLRRHFVIVEEYTQKDGVLAVCSKIK